MGSSSGRVGAEGVAIKIKGGVRGRGGEKNGFQKTVPDRNSHVRWFIRQRGGREIGNEVEKTSFIRSGTLKQLPIKAGGVLLGGGKNQSLSPIRGSKIKWKKEKNREGGQYSGFSARQNPGRETHNGGRCHRT